MYHIHGKCRRKKLSIEGTAWEMVHKILDVFETELRPTGTEGMGVVNNWKVFEVTGNVPKLAFEVKLQDNVDQWLGFKALVTQGRMRRPNTFPVRYSSSL